MSTTKSKPRPTASWLFLGALILLCGCLGVLQYRWIGEVSVAVAVSCPHRADAFAACRHAIDRLKELVPIWKQEHWTDGRTEWVHP